MANELLKLKRKKKEEKDEQREAAKIKQQTEGNIQSAQAAADAKLQIIQAQAQADIKIQETEAQFEIVKKKEEAQLKKDLMEVEFQYNMQLRKMDSQNLQEREKKKEVAKDKRVSLNNTEQSQLIEQRQTKGRPKNFESNEDSLDGFDLAEFSPR